MNFLKPIIPKEHGAWAVLFVPLLVGAAVAGRFTANVLLLVLSALGVFMSHVPVHTILRHLFVTIQTKEKLDHAFIWATVYLGFGLAFMIPLFAQGYWMLLAIGAVGAISFFGNFFLTRRFPKTIPSDILAVFGLSLSGLCSYYVVSGMLDTHAIIIWLLMFLFFCCSVFYVHMKIGAATSKKQELSFAEKLSLGKLNVLYHVAVVVLVIALAILQQTKWFTVLVFVPMAAHAIYGTYKLSGKVRFKNLGFLLLGQSMLFGILLWVVLQ